MRGRHAGVMLAMARRLAIAGPSLTGQRSTGGTAATDPTIQSLSAETLYVVPVNQESFARALPEVAIWKCSYLVFGRSAANVQFNDVRSDGANAFIVTAAPTTQRGYLLAPAERCGVPTPTYGNMAAAQYDGWIIEEGSVFATTVKWPGVSSATGYHARMDVRVARDPDSAAILQLSDQTTGITLSSDGANLVITISVPATTTDDLPFTSSTGYYDLEVVPPAGEGATFKVLYGQIGYRREVTAAP